ncbi:dioxygenase family protein [Microlunatus soli]|uniref:Aromatic ring-opening dioxygenase, catalytic subunit, LigB family n=1 Tax=Microlunatus soli TaxID=630515 RepID=A0A1H1MWC7_9ACTN|nr:class III extradiol ring-cleavage dioxygenase [Microlunatus soli]SDR91183.1 Aromatic ring-opening dioxygenase, catalytic subunit, LigB family [Microlunatus soli]
MPSIFDPGAPAGAFDAFVGEARRAARLRTPWEPASGRMPALFISHGAPPLLDDAEWMDQLFGWAQRLPQPRAILIVSAHWESAPLALSSPRPAAPLVYDFGGFADRYYTLRYETPDASELASLVRSVLPDDQRPHEHLDRGLDHGAWVPLKVMYPNADIPVLQLSLPTGDPAALLELGGRLRALRDHGVLVIGSGFMTHGLPFLTRESVSGATVPQWSTDFDHWATEALGNGDVEELCRYRSAAPGMPYAHPTVDHFIPMFITLGAAADAGTEVTPVIDGYWMGLARTSFQVA